MLIPYHYYHQHVNYLQLERQGQAKLKLQFHQLQGFYIQFRNATTIKKIHYKDVERATRICCRRRRCLVVSGPKYLT